MVWGSVARSRTLPVIWCSNIQQYDSLGLEGLVGIFSIVWPFTVGISVLVCVGCRAVYVYRYLVAFLSLGPYQRDSKREFQIRTLSRTQILGS